MTVSTLDVKVNYTGNGSKKDYDYSFVCYDETHLKVYLDSVLKTLNVHYTVNISLKKVYFVDPPANGAAITIRREIPLTQTVDYQAHDAFPAETHEKALDMLVMTAQQVDEAIDRIFKVPITSSLTNVEVPVGAGKLIGWNGSATGISLYDTTIDTGVITVKGQMIRGGDAGAAEAFAVGNNGDLLTPSGGKPAWKPGVSVYLTNKGGTSSAAGDVFVIDTDNDSAAEPTTTRSDTRPVVIAAETIADSSAGLFTRVGIVTVNVQGNVTRGNFLRCSTTSKRAEDAGSSYYGSVNGLFAQALTAYSGGGAGTVQALLLGSTIPGGETFVGYGPSKRNLRVSTPMSAFSEYQVDIDAEWVIIEGYKTGAIDLTADITVSGLNGLDTGSEAANTWYYIWLIYNPTTATVGSLLSTSSTTPTMPSGYTKKRLISYVRNYGSPGDFHTFRHTGNIYQYLYYSPDPGNVKVVDNGGSTTTASIDLSAVVPPGIQGVFGSVLCNTGALNWFLHPQTFSNSITLDNGLNVCNYVYRAASASDVGRWFLEQLVEDQTMYHQTSAYTVDVQVNGFYTKEL